MSVCVSVYVNSLENDYYRSEAHEVTAFVHLSMSYLNKKIPYKYVIYSKHSSGEWECIRDLQVYGEFYRCLELNQLLSSRKFIIK